MKRSRTRKLSHMLAFLPWPVFLETSGSLLVDYSKIHLGFFTTRQCTELTWTSTATVVRSDAAKRKGLSGRTRPLGPNESMIFLYKDPTALSFWMKNTLIPLQIAFIDPIGNLIETQDMPVEPNPNHPLMLYSSSKPGIAAIEMPPKTLQSGKALILCAQQLK